MYKYRAGASLECSRKEVPEVPQRKRGLGGQEKTLLAQQEGKPLGAMQHLGPILPQLWEGVVWPPLPSSIRRRWQRQVKHPHRHSVFSWSPSTVADGLQEGRGMARDWSFFVGLQRVWRGRALCAWQFPARGNHQTEMIYKRGPHNNIKKMILWSYVMKARGAIYSYKGSWTKLS